MAGAGGESSEGGEPGVGLCSLCRHGRRQETAGDTRFWRCLRAARDPGYRRYPPLPVERCGGFERGPTPQ